MPNTTPTPAEVVRARAYARRDLLNELMNPTEWVSGGVGLNEMAALKLVDAYDATHDAAVRAAAIREAADAVVAFTGSEHDANAKMLRRLAIRPAPTTTPTPEEH